MRYLSTRYSEKKGEMILVFDVAEFSCSPQLYESDIRPILPLPGGEADEALCRKVCAVHTQTVLKLRALRLLSYGDYTARGLLDKLMKTEVPGVPPDREIAKKVVIECGKAGFIRERDYAARLLEKYIKDVRGVYYIEQKMKEKQFRPGLFDELVDENMREQIKAALFDYVKAHQSDDSRQQKRLADAMVRRGHSYADVAAALEHAGREDLP